MEEIIEKIKRAIEEKILAEPKFDDIEAQAQILREKGYRGVSYIATSGKVVSVLEDGTVKVYSPLGQLLEQYPQLLGGD